MELFGREVPCGCDTRKEVMFTNGGLTPQTVMPLVIVGLLMFGAWRIYRA